MDAPEEMAGGGDGHAVTPVRYVAVPRQRGVHGGDWTVLVPEAMASEWTVVHVPAANGVVRVASRGGGVPEVSVDMAALQAALNGRRGDDPDLQLRSGHRGVGGGVAERGGGGAGGPCYFPAVFVPNPNKEAEKKEDRSAVAKASSRFHLAFNQHLAHFTLLMFSSFVVYLFYALQHISKDMYLTMELLQLVGHIVMWAVGSWKMRAGRSTNRSESRPATRSVVTVAKKNG